MSKSKILMISILMLIVVSAAQRVYTQQTEGNKTTVTQKGQEAAVKACIESFLSALGNREYEKVKTMILLNANIASIKITDGKSKIFTMTAE